MSTTQSHIHPGPQNNFNFNPTPTLTQMNLRQDGMRQSGGVPQLPQGAMNGQQHFMPNRQQGEQHGQPPMGMLSSNNTNNPPMNILGGQQGNNAQLATNQQFQAHLAHATQQQRQASLLQQAQTAQARNGGGASGQSMGGLGPNQMGNMGFPNMMQQTPMNQQVRRVQSQPQPLNQAAVAQMQMSGNGIHPGQQAGGSMPMSMNPQNSHLRPHLRMQQQIPNDMATMAMRHQGNPVMPRDMQRSDSQIMGSLSQQPGLSQSHPSTMAPSLPPGGFPTPMSHPQHTMSPSPRLGANSQPQTPANINMVNPGQGQPGMRGSQQDIFNFPTQPFSQGMPVNNGRMNNSQFPFVPSSSPPNHGEMPLMSAASNNRPGGFQMTPAQQLQNAGDGFGNHFGMPPPPTSIPPRPPSNHSITPLPHQQAIHHTSPHDHMSPQRPQSQPQGPPGRPPSGLSNTPQSQLAPHATHPSAGRIPSLAQTPQALHQPQSASGHPLPIAPRPPQPVSAVAGPSAIPIPAVPFTASEGQPGGPQRPSNNPAGGYPLGLGQGLTRLLQFSGILASENKGRLSLAYWELLVKEYFAHQAVMKFTLWKDNQRNEAKPFDIGVPILPRFFLVTAQSGVKSMTLSLDGARERLVSHNHAVIECVTAAWTYKYTNGYTVTLRGPLTAHIVIVPNVARNQAGVQPAQPFTLKFESLDFGANFHDKAISLESIMGPRNPESSPPKTPHQRNAPTPTPNSNGSSASITDEDKKWEEPRVTIDHASIPGEPVNAFGIPQATMRCLELAESVGQMTDLIAFAGEVGTGPIEGLSLYAIRLREMGGANGSVNGSGGFHNFQTLNGVPPTPAVTLYSSVPPPIGPPPLAAQPPTTPQNAPGSATNSPRKQNKTVPQPAATSSTPGTASTSATTPLASSSTPSMANATLKRKQTDTASPITEQPPPAKRPTRTKRGRATGGGG